MGWTKVQWSAMTASVKLFWSQTPEQLIAAMPRFIPALQAAVRQALAVGRVVALGELAESLAHEVNQPLAAILANARAAQGMLADGSMDTAAMHEILNDIAAEGLRAGAVVHRWRGGSGLRALCTAGQLCHAERSEGSARGRSADPSLGSG